MSKLLAEYKNGNCNVELYEDGTKIRVWNDNEKAWAEFPESLDCKITDYCDNPICIAHCHEKSTKKGLHGDIDAIINVLKDLPRGVEIAIGGGNPFSHPRFEEFLIRLKEIGLVSNVTVNAYHVPIFKNQIIEWRNRKLIYGLGISYQPNYVKDLLDIADDNTVVHVIAGVHTPFEVMKLPRQLKLLVLGYKNYGFGEKYYKNNPVEKQLKIWRGVIKYIIARYHTSFDNLGIAQLDIKSLLSQEQWDELYMGDDGTFTMYIDGVKQEYAKSSTSSRQPFNKMNIREMFGQVKKSVSLGVI